jgi:hypothetical protein
MNSVKTFLCVALEAIAHLLAFIVVTPVVWILILIEKIEGSGSEGNDD